MDYMSEQSLQIDSVHHNHPEGGGIISRRAALGLLTGGVAAAIALGCGSDAELDENSLGQLAPDLSEETVTAPEIRERGKFSSLRRIHELFVDTGQVLLPGSSDFEAGEQGFSWLTRDLNGSDSAFKARFSEQPDSLASPETFVPDPQYRTLTCSLIIDRAYQERSFRDPEFAVGNGSLSLVKHEGRYKMLGVAHLLMNNISDTDEAFTHTEIDYAFAYIPGHGTLNLVPGDTSIQSDDERIQYLGDTDEIDPAFLWDLNDEQQEVIGRVEQEGSLAVLDLDFDEVADNELVRYPTPSNRTEYGHFVAAEVTKSVTSENGSQLLKLIDPAIVSDRHPDQQVITERARELIDEFIDLASDFDNDTHVRWVETQYAPFARSLREDRIVLDDSKMVCNGLSGSPIIASSGDRDVIVGVLSSSIISEVRFLAQPALEDASPNCSLLPGMTSFATGIQS